MDIRRAFTPLRIAAAGIFIFFAALALMLLWPGSPLSSDKFLLVPDRAHPLEALVKVPGAKPDKDGGGIYYVDVFERKATLLERLFPQLRKGTTIVEHSDLTPPGVSDQQRFQADQLDMRLSQQVASAVALRALGYDVSIRQTGVRVALVYGGTHATGVLKSGDVIVAAHGRRVTSTIQLHELLAADKVGDVVPITFVRNGIRHTVRIKTSRDPFDRTRAILGIQPQPAIKLHVPFKIKFDLGNVGGPSAGLAFALQILEARGRDVDHGYKVAATGEIGADGSVGEIGGVRQKIFGARQADVDVFLVPAGDNYREAKKDAGDVRVIPVKTFQQALHALATLPPKQ